MSLVGCMALMFACQCECTQRVRMEAGYKHGKHAKSHDAAVCMSVVSVSVAKWHLPAVAVVPSHCL